MDLVNGPLAPARALLERIVSVRSRFGHHSVAIDKYRSFFCSPFSHFRKREGIFLEKPIAFYFLVGGQINNRRQIDEGIEPGVACGSIARLLFSTPYVGFCPLQSEYMSVLSSFFFFE